jgi:hypothetical protein
MRTFLNLAAYFTIGVAGGAASLALLIGGLIGPFEEAWYYVALLPVGGCAAAATMLGCGQILKREFDV